MLRRLARALRAPRPVRSRSGNPFGAEPLEPRRLLASVPATLPVTVSNLQWEVEGGQLGLSIDFLCEARPHEAYASFGDGTVKNLPMDYDPSTGRGRVHGLYDYALPGDHPVTVAVRRGQWIDAETFLAHTDTPAARPALTDDSSPDGSFSAASPDDGGTVASGEDSLLAEGETTSSETPPPAVRNVYVRGTAWSYAFRNFIAGTGVGHHTLGLQIDDADQLNELPWINIDQVSIEFTEPVNVTKDDLTINGAADQTYATTSFSVSSFGTVATWQLASPLPLDKVLLTLRDEVRGSGGQKLDGEWSSGAGRRKGGRRKGDIHIFRGPQNRVPGGKTGTSLIPATLRSSVSRSGGTGSTRSLTGPASTA